MALRDISIAQAKKAEKVAMYKRIDRWVNSAEDFGWEQS